MNFCASLEYAVGVMIGSCSVIGVVGAKYCNHYAQIVMVGISITMEVGGWVQVSLGFVVVENHPKIPLNQY